MSMETSPAEGQRHVVVVGMHRSGTSAMANALFRLGLALPDETDLITPGPYNERGYWELRRFVTFDDRVLHHLGGTWSAPPRPDSGWEHSPESAMSAIRSDAVQFAKREFGHRHMVLKDPRLCITLPLWREVFDTPPVAIVVLRDPGEVALSLERRNNFPLTLSLALWDRYVRQSIVSVEGLSVFCVEYGNLLQDPLRCMDAVAEFIGQCGIPVETDRVGEAAGVLEPSLRHYHSQDLGKTIIDDSASVSGQGNVLDVLRESLGSHASWSAPAVGPEPPWVDDVIRLVAAGEAVTFANESARTELKWIKRSRLFRATTRTWWRLTGTGPVLSPDPEEPPDHRTDTREGPDARGRRESSIRASMGPPGSGLERLKDGALRRLQPTGRADDGAQIQHEANPTRAETLADYRMLAVIKSWMDEDVIEATVRNALVQGADAVYLVDNASTDSTLQIATAAGAIVAEVYESDLFDGRLVQQLVNAVVARESLRCGAEHVWWLLLDSDEFPEGPDGMCLRDYLGTLDRRFRIVGATYMNHVPSGRPEYVAGFHPIDFQPLCYPFAPARNPPCGLGHWKHPLQRFDRHGHFLLSNDGAHTAYCSEPLVEPEKSIITHHFQYRDEDLTRAKLELVCGSGSRRAALHESAGFKGFVRRRRSVDAVYSQRWKDMDLAPNLHSSSECDPKPWPNLSGIRRWYAIEEATAAGRREATADRPLRSI